MMQCPVENQPFLHRRNSTETDVGGDEAFLQVAPPASDYSVSIDLTLGEGHPLLSPAKQGGKWIIDYLSQFGLCTRFVTGGFYASDELFRKYVTPEREMLQVTVSQPDKKTIELIKKIDNDKELVNIGMQAERLPLSFTQPTVYASLSKKQKQELPLTQAERLWDIFYDATIAKEVSILAGSEKDALQAAVTRQTTTTITINSKIFSWQLPKFGRKTENPSVAKNIQVEGFISLIDLGPIRSCIPVESAPIRGMQTPDSSVVCVKCTPPARWI